MSRTDTHHTSSLYMAPLRGFTDHIYRNTFSEHFSGFDLAVAPFITGKKGDKVPRKYIKGLLPENNTGMPVVPQILSKSAKEFILLANHLFNIGYETINWNLGCPYPMVAKKQRGSGMLPHQDMIREFLDHVIPALKGRLSIKTRLGWQTKDDIFRLIPLFNQYPIEEIIIHPRTGKQMYEGTTDLEAFEKLLSMTIHATVYNGDIRSLDDFKRLSQRFNTVNRWMIGRWALVNPFLPLMIKTGKDSISNKTVIMKRFHDDLFNQYSQILSGPSHLLDRMKGLWRYFSLAFKDCNIAMKKIKKTRKPDQYTDLVNHFFEAEAEWFE